MWHALHGRVYESELTQVALGGDVDALRLRLAQKEQEKPGSLTSPAGRHRLRYLASAAAYENQRAIGLDNPPVSAMSRHSSSGQ